jgi:8-oxo-dGTP diphosphatase
MADAEAPLYERDPEAWRAHLAEGNATQPRKRVGADLLLRDAQGRVLLVNPSYKPGWDLPGGMSEANEAPVETARRELKEELGLDTPVGALLCVDWVPPHGPWDDSLMFIFDGGVLTVGQIGGLRPLDNELDSFEFCAEQEIEQRLRPRAHRRLVQALAAARAGSPRYLHDGVEA